MFVLLLWPEMLVIYVLSSHLNNRKSILDYLVQTCSAFKINKTIDIISRPYITISIP
jgi:hypothetical protein